MALEKAIHKACLAAQCTLASALNVPIDSMAALINLQNISAAHDGLSFGRHT